jgi:hypothetical protein
VDAGEANGQRRFLPGERLAAGGRLPGRVAGDAAVAGGVAGALAGGTAVFWLPLADAVGLPGLTLGGTPGRLPLVFTGF